MQQNKYEVEMEQKIRRIIKALVFENEAKFRLSIFPSHFSAISEI